MSIPDFHVFITDTVELLRPHAKRVMDGPVREDETPEEADRDMAILGAFSNLLCLKTWLDNDFVKVVDGSQIECLKAVKWAAAEVL